VNINKALPFMAASCLLFAAGIAQADGTETLGTPSIAISAGTGLYADGTGMVSQPGSFNLEVPAGATVNQVILYWEGFMDTDTAGDDTVTVSNDGGMSSVSVTGTLIGGPTFFFPGAYASTFRADITGEGLVSDGVTTLQISDMDFTTAANGAGAIVIFDDGSSDGNIAVVDGSDLAFINFAPPLDTTVPQTFTFPASNADRTAQISMFFASVAGSVSGGTLRPTAIELTTDGPNGGTTTLNNVLDSISGDEFDAFTISLDIPKKSTSVTVQPLSVDNLGTGDLPASFDWLAAGFGIEPEEQPGSCGRMTGGGSVFTTDGVRVTRGFEIHCDLRNPNNLQVNWPGHRFHMVELTSALCTDSPAIDQTPPPSAPFDTFQGTGRGRLNREPGAHIQFVFVDAGEPGTMDTASIKIYDKDDNLVLDVPGDPSLPGYLRKGNLQTHKDNKCVEEDALTKKK
jgi:hypothetical protein